MTEDSTNRLLKNYFNARKSWEGWCFLNSIDLKTPNKEVKKYVDKNELLFYLRYLLIKDLHIELYKILKDNRNTTDNIFKLLRNKNTEKANSHLQKLIKFSNEISLLTDTRDKFYAHLDPEYEKFIDSYEVENYYKTFELIEEAIIVLDKKAELLSILEKIPSRDEFELNLKNYA